MGTGYYGGIIDYLNYVNMKHGGVNGVKLTYEECETEYNAARTVECYQRLLNKGDQKMVVFDTLGTPGAYAVIGRMAQDHVVLAQYGYGRTDAADGRVWPWVFNAAGHYWGQIAVKMNYIAQKEGGVDKMKGKTIVHLHIDTAYGREPLPAMRQIAKDWGFKLIEIAVPPPGLEQQSQWLQIRKREGRLGHVLGRRLRHELDRDHHRRPCRLSISERSYARNCSYDTHPSGQSRNSIAAARTRATADQPQFLPSWMPPLRCGRR